MAEKELATERQIKRLYAVVLQKYKENNNIGGDEKLSTAMVQRIMGRFKEDHEFGNYSKLDRDEISRLIDEVKFGKPEPEPEPDPEPEPEEGKGEENLSIGDEYADLEEEFIPVVNTQNLDQRIAKYVEILAKVTAQVEKEQRIPDLEKGYAVKFIFDAVTRDMRSELIAKLRAPAEVGV